MIRPTQKHLILVTLSGLAGSLLLAGCPAHYPKDYDADKKSGEDAKRSGANVLRVNKSRTDEVSFANQDKTDWFVTTLKGEPGVLNAEVHWDNAKSDLMVDVFDEFGKQLSASPTRSPGSTQKQLLTSIDHVGIYYIRVTAPKPTDGSVYTLEAKWDEPAEIVQPIAPIQPPIAPIPRPKHPHEEHEPKERPVAASETIQGHIVNAYREAGQLVIHLDKGSAAGVKAGMSGTVLMGPSGEDPLPGGTFKVVQVLDEHKSVARCSPLSIGKNTRVAITVK
ncbi:MAG: hypothetical protein ABI321_24590 [Polyangia bacterium]